MTIQEVLTNVDEKKPNAIDDGIKLSWLNEIEETIYKEIILTHEDGEEKKYRTININSDYETELLAESPYSRLYEEYIMSKIDFQNAEWERYNNTVEQFNESYEEYAAYYNRNHMPKKRTRLRGLF